MFVMKVLRWLTCTLASDPMCVLLSMSHILVFLEIMRLHCSWNTDAPHRQNKDADKAGIRSNVTGIMKASAAKSDTIQEIYSIVLIRIAFRIEAQFTSSYVTYLR